MSELLFLARAVFFRSRGHSRGHSGLPPRSALTRDTLEVCCRQVSKTLYSINQNTAHKLQGMARSRGKQATPPRFALAQLPFGTGFNSPVAILTECAVKYL